MIPSTTARRKSRELILQALFQLEFTSSLSLADSLKRLENLFTIAPDILNYANELASQFDNFKQQIDDELQAMSKNWSINRMATVDKNILRLALLEMRYIEETPPKVAINEAIEMAKIYGSTDSSQFINGILDQAFKESST